MNCSVYIIYSENLDRFYVGTSADVEKRLIEHNNNESSYTSTGSPWILIWKTTKSSRVEAEKLEIKLKNLSIKRKIKFIQKYNLGIIAKDIFDKIVQVSKK